MFSFPMGRAPSPGGIASLTPRPTAPAPIPPQIMATPTAMSPMTQRGMTQQVMPSNRTPSMISAFRNGPAGAQLDAFRQMRAGANPRSPYGKTGAATSPVPSMAAPQAAAPQMVAPAVMPMAPDAGMQQAYSGFQSAAPAGAGYVSPTLQAMSASPMMAAPQMSAPSFDASMAPIAPMTQAQAQAQMGALMGQSAPTLGMAAGGQVSAPTASSQSSLDLATVMRTGTPEQKMAALEQMRASSGSYVPFGTGTKGATSTQQQQQQPEQKTFRQAGRDFRNLMMDINPEGFAQMATAARGAAERRRPPTTTAT